MNSGMAGGWPVVFVGAELLRKRPSTLLDLLNQRCDAFSLVIDASGTAIPSAFPPGVAWKQTLARCTRIAICLGGSAALGIIWHHRMQGVNDVERRLFIDVRRALAWAEEPHRRRPSLLNLPSWRSRAL